jgi:hypothetical protein
MKIIYKYELKSMISMPSGAEILCVKEQRGACMLYALIDTENPPEIRKFSNVVTGGPMSKLEVKYIGTVMMFGGSYVQHIFELL